MSAHPAPTSRSRGILAALAVCALLAFLLLAWSRTGPDPAAANPLTGMAAVATGGGHTCALTAAGGVKCWGNNRFGQLGDGTNTDRIVQVDVIGLTSGVAAVAAGGSHTCALTTGGGLKCWGANSVGQLGAATTETCFGGVTPCSTTPVDVVGMTSGVAVVTAGGSHTCALTTAGGIKCWGSNSGGSAPVDVVGLTSGVASVTAGSHHTCALTTAGGLKCWGSNSQGQLGDGSTTFSTTPVDVVGLTSGVASVTAGSTYTCAVTTAGGVKCWGGNSWGRLGDGTNTTSTTPVDVAGLTSSVAAVTAGTYHTCALTTAGGAKCWGNNSAGQLGDGAGGSFGDLSLTPVDVSGLTSGVAAVAAGEGHTCALTTAGGLKCWGQNHLGQLGDGTSKGRLTPVDVVVDVVKPTPTVTPCPAGGCPTPTPNPPGPAMSLAAPGTVFVGEPFVVAVKADPAPNVQVAAFGSEVLYGAAPELGECENGTDDDGDGVVNDGCPQRGDAPEIGVQCGNNLAEGDAYVNDGCPQVGATSEAGSLCDNATDDDGDGFVNDGCPGAGERGADCTNDTDDDGDGLVNEGCPAAGGLRWLPRATCFDEVLVRSKIGSLALCKAGGTLLGGARHAVISSLSLPVDPLDVVPGSITTLVELDFICEAVGSYKLTLTEWSSDSLSGAVFASTDATKIQVKTVEHDYDGDTVPNRVADTIDIDCGVRGDVSCDGAVAIADAQLIAQLMAGRISELACPDHADVDGSGVVDITDAQLIAQLILGRIDSLPGS